MPPTSLSRRPVVARFLFTLLAGLHETCGFAQSPLPDESPAFFSGDWIGTGAQDAFCFMRLQPDGMGTVLAMSASGDWLGARVRWRNRRQNLEILAVHPLPGDPHRRLAPLSGFSLSLGFGTTIRLRLDAGTAYCEMQRRAAVERNVGNAGMLLGGADANEGAHGGR
jgi:hypothetical protein